MTPRDRLLALTVVVLWGCNFLAIRVGLDHFPPFFFGALRFAVIAIPVVLFVPRPVVPLRWLVLYGAGFGFGQFAFLFWAMESGLPTGLASLVLQASAPLTVVLGAVLLRERLGGIRIAGVLTAVAGMVVVAFAHGAADASLVPMMLALLAGLSWAIGNIATRKAASREPMRLMLWMCVVPVLPLLAVSWVVEGPSAWVTLGTAFTTADGALALAGLTYIVLLATIVGNGIYVALMSRYPASTVAPLSLMVPIVGFAAAGLAFGEEPALLTLLGGAVVIAGALAAQVAPSRRSAAPGPVEHSPTWELALKSPRAAGSPCAPRKLPPGRPRRPDAARGR
ncbi:EamA family transporter [Rhodococcus sp. (in: high G+C Gram-positive bacteria)]|uniref:EamA family transporter n=1 Tax=Rhodococcus sp. TaxID=1831 RepID=UPI001A011C31|nr:EamA family transporter [Rhodococcus sp. (in: high G+C Gram-positive bacteria)]MBF0660958.1 EamA family transporter [Rhodococcus sp. (in: high G+C Gram-positive bacteria)]